MERKKVILIAGLLTIGFIIVGAGLTYAYNWGLFNPPIGDKPTPNSHQVPIYCQAKLDWHKLPILTNALLGWSGYLSGTWYTTLIPHSSSLDIANVDCSQTQPYTMSVGLLWLGSGNIQCRADLVNAEGVTINSAQNSLPPIGNIGLGGIEDSTENWNFKLNGWSEQSYKINVKCVDSKNPENWDTFVKEVTTV